METIILFLISKFTINLNIDINEIFKYIINNINIKTATKFLILILEIIMLSNMISKVCEPRVTITENQNIPSVSITEDQNIIYY